MSFTVTQPYRTDLPEGLNPYFFATLETANALAAKFGGTAYQEPTGPGILNGEPAFFISFPGKRVDWNAGMLYQYLQKKPDYNPAA